MPPKRKAVHMNNVNTLALLLGSANLSKREGPRRSRRSATVRSTQHSNYKQAAQAEKKRKIEKAKIQAQALANLLANFKL